MGKAKHIFVTGGVVSGLGKGITAASLGRLLKARGLKVAAQKLDPYMNVDPGTMNPYQHGEVFVTDDGAETDLDLGHYERFIDENLNSYSNLTSGRVYFNVLTRERTGGYLGQTVQVIPHITDEIKRFIYTGAEGADVLITEIGGTVGDIEGQPFLEAIRQISLEIGKRNCLFIHLALIPYLKGSGEHKSKPAQHSVKELRAMGISPDIIVARSDERLNSEILAKLSLFCNVKPDCVIENITLNCLYEAPLMLNANGLDKMVCRELALETPEPDMDEWKAMTARIAARQDTVTVAMVGKYVRLHDAYLSVIEALGHAGFEFGANVEIVWIDSEQVTRRNVSSLLHSVHGILVPGGFGERGIEGMIIACQYARENRIPFLGLCLGMHIAVIEFARSVCGLENANSSEFDLNSEKVIALMEEQNGIVNKGGTMRLGAYPCKVEPGTMLAKAYKADVISERHRHRYEFNNSYKDKLCDAGLVLCGISPDGVLVEAVELEDHPFFVGVQFHPEFKSRPNKPHPLFLEFIRASQERNKPLIDRD
ncbi:MAG: CTP synthase [Clostridiales bacterium]|nr:CTP synthase [Clostridiales bacterium]